MRTIGVRIGMVLSAAVLFALAMPIRAQDSWGGSLAIASDYVYRGVSLSRGRTAYQAGAHLRLPDQWQISVWGSTIETRDNDGTPVEADFTVAHAWNLGTNWSLRAGYTRYQYFGLPGAVNYDHDEVHAVASFRSQLALGVSFSPNVVRYRYQQSELQEPATAVDATWSQPVYRDWYATAGLGYYDLSELYDTGYAYWHVGMTGAVGPVDLDVLFIDTDEQAARIYGESTTGDRWSATVRWRF